MVKVFCDKCHVDCGLSAFVLTIQSIHNPTPANLSSFGRVKLTDDNTHITMCLCQNCYKELKLPNIYSSVNRGMVVWDEGTGAASSNGAQPNCERNEPEKPAKTASREYSSR